MRNKIPTIIKRAYEEFLIKDKFLLMNDVSERAIAHRFALYLERYFPEFNVDCEYNRDGLGERPKLLNKLGTKARALGIDINKPRRVYPDIIVHKRGEEIGVLAIEFQKSNKPKKHKDYDLIKLRAYKGELGYSYAFSITLPIKKNINIESVGGLIKSV